MNMFDVLQLIGGIILSIGFIPQIIQLIRTKTSRDLNIKTQFLVFAGIVLMEIYAIHIAIVSSVFMFLITNSMSLSLAIAMCVLAVKYKDKVPNDIVKFVHL